MFEDNPSLDVNWIDCILDLVPRVMAMLAMRACRSSIMIGTTLRHKQMKSILENLAKLDSPWNCPHGRPTLRHLCVLPNDH